IVIFDLDLRKVVQRLPTPNGGSTHSGAFVRYDGWKGEVQADHNGFLGRTLALKRKMLGIAPAAPVKSTRN
ncbi:MAG: hypothetical protein EBT83_11260, partial [Betaproteobacteria bacterium]|nr:hypothetical protein [Betaproteobacteria bacterium]